MERDGRQRLCAAVKKAIKAPVGPRACRPGINKPSQRRGFTCSFAGWANDRTGPSVKKLFGATIISTQPPNNWACCERNSRGRGAGATSLVPKRVNGIEERGFPGRIIAEENPDRGAEQESDQDGFGRNEGRPVLGRGNDF